MRNSGVKKEIRWEPELRLWAAVVYEDSGYGDPCRIATFLGSFDDCLQLDPETLHLEEVDHDRSKVV